jgi:hypothetical protein
MAKQGTGSLREPTAPQTSVRGARASPLGRRRLPPAANDNRPTILRVLKISVGPLLIAVIAAAVYWQ